MPLAEARERAAAARRLSAGSVDPIVQRDKEAAERRAEAARAITFKQCAAAYIAAHSGAWKSVKHGSQWEATLETYAYPIIGDLAAQAVDVALVHKILDPIWSTKPETASRVRGRVESILDWAAARGYRTGENPARWRGHLENLFPARSKVRKVKHHAALPYRDIGVFMAALRDQKGNGALALQFAILTAARTSEVLGMQWSEIDLEARVWTVPARRMKGGKEHRVPLCAAAVTLLKDLDAAKGIVFKGASQKSALSNMSMLAVLKRMGRADLTAHGFRSTFRDWAAEQTSFPGDVAEAALAHAVADKVEAAYRRGDLFEKRRRLMDAWGAYCSTAARDSGAIPIRRAER